MVIGGRQWSFFVVGMVAGGLGGHRPILVAMLVDYRHFGLKGGEQKLDRRPIVGRGTASGEVTVV